MQLTVWYLFFMGIFHFQRQKGPETKREADASRFTTFLVYRLPDYFFFLLATFCASGTAA